MPLGWNGFIGGRQAVMDEKEKLTKFEITKCYEKGADYKILLSNEKMSLVDVWIRVYHDVRWDHSKEGEIWFEIRSFHDSRIIRDDFCYDLPSFYKQLALGIDRIASYYKNDKNTVILRTTYKELAEALDSLDLWNLSLDDDLYTAERALEPSEIKNVDKPAFSEDVYERSVSNISC